MDRTFLQERIETKAYSRLSSEYHDWREKFVGRSFARGLVIKEAVINSTFPEYLPSKKDWDKHFGETHKTNFSELLKKREIELIEEESEQIINKLSQLDYLFNQQ